MDHNEDRPNPSTWECCTKKRTICWSYSCFSAHKVCKYNPLLNPLKLLKPNQKESRFVDINAARSSSSEPPAWRVSNTVTRRIFLHKGWRFFRKSNNSKRDVGKQLAVMHEGNRSKRKPPMSTVPMAFFWSYTSFTWQTKHLAMFFFYWKQHWKYGIPGLRFTWPTHTNGVCRQQMALTEERIIGSAEFKAPYMFFISSALSTLPVPTVDV